MIVGGIALLILYTFAMADTNKWKYFNDSISAVGRLSLSWFFLHIVIFNEFTAWIGIKNAFNAWQTLSVVLLVMLVIILLSVISQKRKFKFSLEWVMRRVI